MARVHDSIEISATIEVVFDRWLRFENYPEFMTGIEQVQRLDEARLHWRGCINGELRDWETEVIENVPDRRLAWKSAEHLNDAVIDMHATEFGTTRISVEMDLEPSEPAAGAVAYVEGAANRLHLDLERFREWLQQDLPGREKPPEHLPLH